MNNQDSGWAQGTREPVWAIDGGDPVRTWGLFTDRWFRDGRPVTFEIGESDELLEWPAFHPGPLDGSHGLRQHTIEIGWHLNEPHRTDACELFFDVYAARGPCPQLIIEVNEHRGLVVFEPSRHDRAEIISGPIAGWATRTVVFPSEWLRTGRNTLSITTTDSEIDELPTDQGINGPFSDFFGSGIRYREIRLDWLSSLPEAPTVDVYPRPLFRSHNGILHETIDVVVGLSRPATRVEVSLSLDGGPISDALADSSYEFGDRHYRFEIPEPRPDTRADVDVVTDNDRWRDTSVVSPARKWTVLVIPHVHLDVGFTDYQGKVLELHARNLDRVLTVLPETPDYRFSVDGTLPIEEFIATRRPREIDKLYAALRSGAIAASAFPFSFLTGVMSLEELLHSADGARQIAEGSGASFTYVGLTDVPSYTASLPTILHHLGIDRFMGLPNHTRASTPEGDQLHLVSPFLWEGPDGARVVTFLADHYVQLRRLASDYLTIPGLASGLTRFLTRYDRDDYPFDVLPVVGTHTDNEDLDDVDIGFVESWNKIYAYPRLRYASIGDYFDAVADRQDEMKVFRGDGGSYWEDGVGTNAAASATYRRTQRDLVSAETLLALTATASARYEPPVEQLEDAYRSLLYGAEHTWTYAHATDFPFSDQAQDQLAWKLAHIERAARIASDYQRKGVSQLNELVASSGPAVIVFNPSSWARTADVVVETPPGTEVCNTHGDAIPVEVVAEWGGMRKVRFAVKDLPGFGYRCLPLRPTTYDSEDHKTIRIDGVFSTIQYEPPRVETPGHDRPVSSLSVSTARYDVAVKDGRLTSLRHRTTSVEILDGDSPWALGEIVRVVGPGTEKGRGRGRERTSITDTFWFLPQPELSFEPISMQVAEVREVPGGHVIEFNQAAGPIPATLELRFFDDIDRVDLKVWLQKPATLAKESLYVAFPFAVGQPTRAVYDRQIGWIDPQRDHLPGAANEWFTTQYAVVIGAVGSFVTWTSVDAPLFTFGGPVTGRWPERAEVTNGTLMSWIMNNYWFTNTPAYQEGEWTGHYSFWPDGAGDLAAAGRFGREVRSPFIAGVVGSLDKRQDWARPLQPEGVLLEVECSSNVVANTAWNRTRSSLVVRLHETAGRAGSAQILHPHGAGGQAHVVDGAGRRMASIELGTGGELTIELAPAQLLAVELENPSRSI